MILGEYFQIQDDFFDCYASPESLGKVGTDIEEGKCTWLAVMAFKHGTSEHKELLQFMFDQECRSVEDVKKVKELYSELELPLLFESVEKQMTEKAEAAIAAVNHAGLEKVLKLLFARIHKRSK